MEHLLIDTHSHLYLDKFNHDIHEVVARAKANHLQKIYLPNIDSGTLEAMHALKNAYPDFFEIMVGLHPTDVKENYEAELTTMTEEAARGTYCAIGEIGIDLYWDKTFLKEQEIAFETQVQLAIDTNLPFVIHARDSFSEIFNCLRKFDSTQLKGVFHSFTGTYDEARTALTLGDFKLGINGIVTFKNSGLAQTVAQLGLNHLVLETDAPFLAPVPHRGKRNESAYLLHIAQHIAHTLQVDLNEVAAVTSKNANYVFGKK